jgi:hypothetical protein
MSNKSRTENVLTLQEPVIGILYMKVKLFLGIMVAAAAAPLAFSASETPRPDFSIALPPGYHIQLKVGFKNKKTGWEENLILWRRSGDAVAQWNNYFPPKLSPYPDWGPWQDTNPDVPIGLYFTSQHKEGALNGNLDWKNGIFREVESMTPDPTDPEVKYAIIQWSDGVDFNAATVELAIGPSERVTAKLLKSHGKRSK